MKIKKNKFNLPKSFLLFVLLSLLFWVLNNLSEEYVTEQTMDVEYVNLPHDKLLQKEPRKQIKLNIKGTGFKLIALRFSNLTIDIDAGLGYLQKKNSVRYSLVLKDQQQKIQKQLLKGLEIDHFIDEVILLEIGVLISKKVPVIAMNTIQYKAGYDLINTIKIQPDSIIITGPESILKSINKIDLEKLQMSDVEQNIHKEIAIIVPENIKVKVSKVMLTGTVEKFTEGSFEIPFYVENLPDGIKINTFPKQIKVIFKVGLSNFNKITEDSFRVVCDYKYSEKNNFSFLVPKITRKPSLVKSVKLDIEKIDFLIQK